MPAPTSRLLRSPVSRMGYYYVKLYRGQDIGERVKKPRRDRELWKSCSKAASASTAAIIAPFGRIGWAYTLLPSMKPKSGMAAGTLNRTGAKRFYALESAKPRTTGNWRDSPASVHRCGQQWFESLEQLRRHQLVCQYAGEWRDRTGGENSHCRSDGDF
jgi:hypothetical protein